MSILAKKYEFQISSAVIIDHFKNYSPPSAQQHFSYILYE